MSDITRIITGIEQGNVKATDKLLPLVYKELRRLAAQIMSHEKPGQTLQATALVHEAYIRLVQAKDQNWNSHGHFFKAAAEAMRRILVENARKKKSLKHGGDRQRIELSDSLMLAPQEICSDDLLALNDALDKLSAKDNISADLIKLRLFGGLTVKQAAEMLDISLSKAYADLEYARAWLRIEIARSSTNLAP